MSYLNTKIVRRQAPIAAYGPRRGARPRGMAGWFDDIVSVFSPGVGTAVQAPAAAINDAQCDATAHAAQAVYDQQMASIASAWANRDGFYSIADAQAVLDKGLALQQQGLAIIDQITNDYGEGISSAMKSARDGAQNDLFDVGKTAIDFTTALNAAKAANATVLDAIGLKDWIIDCISAAGRAAYVGTYFNCLLVDVQPYLAPLKVLLTAEGAFVAVVTKVVTIAVNAGDVLYKTTVGALDLTATVVKYAPYIAGAYGLAWLWKNYGQR